MGSTNIINNSRNPRQTPNPSRGYYHRLIIIIYIIPGLDTTLQIVREDGDDDEGACAVMPLVDIAPSEVGKKEHPEDLMGSVWKQFHDLK